MIRATLLVTLGTAGFLWGDSQFNANLSGYEEVPALSTTGSGQISVKIAQDQKSLSVTLTFNHLEGVAQTAILGFGMPGTTGGLLAYICGGLKTACPTSPGGTATTTILALDIQAIAGQGIAAGDLAAAILAIENGAVYANVRTTTFPNGEIRGQIGEGNGPKPGKGRGHNND